MEISLLDLSKPVSINTSDIPDEFKLFKSKVETLTPEVYQNNNFLDVNAILTQNPRTIPEITKYKQSTVYNFSQNIDCQYAIKHVNGIDGMLGKENLKDREKSFLTNDDNNLQYFIKWIYYTKTVDKKIHVVAHNSIMKCFAEFLMEKEIQDTKQETIQKRNETMYDKRKTAIENNMEEIAKIEKSDAEQEVSDVQERDFVDALKQPTIPDTDFNKKTGGAGSWLSAEVNKPDIIPRPSHNQSSPQNQEPPQSRFDAAINQKQFVFTRHTASCNNAAGPVSKDYEPGITYYGVVRALQKKDTKINDSLLYKSDKVYVSCLIRTWETATILYLFNLDQKQSLRLVVSPFLKELNQPGMVKGTYYERGNNPIYVFQQLQLFRYFLQYLKNVNFVGFGSNEIKTKMNRKKIKIEFWKDFYATFILNESKEDNLWITCGKKQYNISSPDKYYQNGGNLGLFPWFTNKRTPDQILTEARQDVDFATAIKNPRDLFKICKKQNMWDIHVTVSNSKDDICLIEYSFGTGVKEYETADSEVDKLCFYGIYGQRIGRTFSNTARQFRNWVRGTRKYSGGKFNKKLQTRRKKDYNTRKNKH